MLEINRERLIQMMNELTEVGGTNDGGLTRLALSDDDARARQWFEKRLEALDINSRVDRFGNIFGRLEGNDPTAAPILIGSHLDSQPNGGRYDGQFGICAALEFLHSLSEQDRRTHRPIEVVNWTNEEGSRFQPPMQGSGVWAGIHDIDEEYLKTDNNGIILKDELERIGYLGEIPCEPNEPYSAYLELHIEQGPYLDINQKQVGIVTGVVGQTWGEATFYGESDHTGPTAMHHRSDALVAAANAILAIRELAKELGDHTVGTVGSINVDPNSPNVIPEEVTITWDIRDPNDIVVDKARERTVSVISSAAEQEGVDWECEETAYVDSIDFSERCINSVEYAADHLDYSSMKLSSGAGHDASHLAGVCDTGMVFSVSENGKSHSPTEFTSWDDCYSAANTFANAVLQLAEN